MHAILGHIGKGGTATDAAALHFHETFYKISPIGGMVHYGCGEGAEDLFGAIRTVDGIKEKAKSIYVTTIAWQRPEAELLFEHF